MPIDRSRETAETMKRILDFAFAFAAFVLIREYAAAERHRNHANGACVPFSTFIHHGQHPFNI